jgi:hypothetical protein
VDISADCEAKRSCKTLAGPLPLESPIRFIDSIMTQTLQAQPNEAFEPQLHASLSFRGKESSRLQDRARLEIIRNGLDSGRAQLSKEF